MNTISTTQFKTLPINSYNTNRHKTIRCQSNSTSKNDMTRDVVNVRSNIRDDMKITSWAPELINGRCAMLGYGAGYGYEIVKHESLSNQFVDYWPCFAAVALVTTFATLKTGKPNLTDVKINGLTPDAELFNGRAAMIGISSTLLYEMINSGQLSI